MYYFVSDIHLGAGTPQEAKATEQRFLAFLDRIESDAEALFLVGDIFDFWWEYERVVPKGFVRVLGRLATMADRGIRIVMLTGNHDMWVGDYLKCECGIELYTEPITEHINGKRLFLAHGDNLNIGDSRKLRFMHWLFRSPFIRRFFSTFVHPDRWVRFGQGWSRSSRRAHLEREAAGLARNEAEILAPLVEYATQYGAEHPEIDYFVFGHLHIPTDIATPRRMLFLGAWDNGGSYLTLNNNGEIALHKI